MLEKMLADMIDVTRKSPIAVHQVLKGGLHIYLRKEEDGFHLVLMRQKVRPSMREWNTVLAMWPWLVVKNPVYVCDGENHFLKGVISDREG